MARSRIESRDACYVHIVTDRDSATIGTQPRAFSYGSVSDSTIPSIQQSIREIMILKCRRLQCSRCDRCAYWGQNREW